MPKYLDGTIINMKMSLINTTFKTETCFDHHQCNPGCNIYLYIKIIWIKLHDIQGFQSGPVPGTFTILILLETTLNCV
jgi:hypothetical protein